MGNVKFASFHNKEADSISHHPVVDSRFGYAAFRALQAGFDHARGEVIIAMDGDLQHDPYEVPLFIERIAHEREITVFGREKVLDFTYVDDCVDGVLRGIDALVGGDLKRETINLAHGQG